jgi:hypothetical protein
MKKIVFIFIVYFLNNSCYSQNSRDKFYSFGTIILFDCNNGNGYSSYILNNNGFFIQTLFKCNNSDTFYKSKLNEIIFNKVIGELVSFDSTQRINVKDITILNITDSAFTNLYRVKYKIKEDSIDFLFLSSLSKIDFERRNKIFNFQIGENSKYKFYLFEIAYFACNFDDSTLGYRINQNYYTYKEKQ